MGYGSDRNPKGSGEGHYFFSIMGRGGECYGISVYEGYKGLNDFLMLAMQQDLNLFSEYALFRQKNLTCYWGNREELTDKQRKTIKDLGYTYRGKNQWLYFMSFVPGYFHYNLDAEEAPRMIEHLRDLDLVLRHYELERVKVDFEQGNMLLATFAQNTGDLQLEEAPLPFTDFQFGELLIEDEEILSDLAGAPKCKAVLEAEMVVDFVTQYGAPREIRVSNMIVEAGLEQICQVCGIKLRRVKRLPVIESFRQGMGRFN